MISMEHQERILNKAHELFMRYGIRSVSMDEIANHLGMSKKTIYLKVGHLGIRYYWLSHVGHCDSQ